MTVAPLLRVRRGKNDQRGAFRAYLHKFVPHNLRQIMRSLEANACIELPFRSGKRFQVKSFHFNSERIACNLPGLGRILVPFRVHVMLEEFLHENPCTTPQINDVTQTWIKLQNEADRCGSPLQAAPMKCGIYISIKDEVLRTEAFANTGDPTTYFALNGKTEQSRPVQSRYFMNHGRFLGGLVDDLLPRFRERHVSVTASITSRTSSSVSFAEIGKLTVCLPIRSACG